MPSIPEQLEDIGEGGEPSERDVPPRENLPPAYEDLPAESPYAYS
jgi:hypothetical protein